MFRKLGRARLQDTSDTSCRKRRKLLEAFKMTFTVELRESADTTNSHYPHHRLQCPSNGVQTSQVPQSRALVCLGGNVRLLPHCRHVRVIHRVCQDLQDISRAEQVHAVPAPAGGPARPPGPGGASCHDAGRREDGLEVRSGHRRLP